MKTLTRRSDAPSTTPGTRVRQLCAVAVVVPALTLTACSSESPVTADPTAAAATASAAATTSTTPPTTSATPTGTASTTATEPTSGPRVNSAVVKTFTDRFMGHAVTVGTVSRDIPWPKGNPVSEDAFEIVGVYVRSKAGGRYSATIEPSMFALTTADKGLVEPTTQFGSTLGRPLGVAKRGGTSEGWLFFKVDRGAKAPLTLYLRRPAYAVSTTGATIPATRSGIQVAR
jgi:hypothetical protein